MTPPRRKRHQRAAVIRSTDLGFPPEVADRGLELLHGDAFKKVMTQQGAMASSRAQGFHPDPLEEPPSRNVCTGRRRSEPPHIEQAAPARSDLSGGHNPHGADPTTRPSMPPPPIRGQMVCRRRPGRRSGFVLLSRRNLSTQLDCRCIYLFWKISSNVFELVRLGW